MRKWLTDNKVYFETFGILILGCTGLFLAWQANTIAHSQAQLARFQNLIAEAQLAPDFQATTRMAFRPDIDGGRGSYYTVGLFNRGGEVNHLSIYAVSLIRHHPAPTPSRPTESLLYLVPWFRLRSWHQTGSEEGLLWWYDAHRFYMFEGQPLQLSHWKMLDMLRNRLSEHQGSYHMYTFEECFLLVLEYEDALGLGRDGVYVLDMQSSAMFDADGNEPLAETSMFPDVISEAATANPGAVIATIEDYLGSDFQRDPLTATVPALAGDTEPDISLALKSMLAGTPCVVARGETAAR